MEFKTLHIQNELSKIQHRFGYLPESELRSLAARSEAQGVRLPLHRLHEVASFFPHFRLKPQSGLEVKVCRDMTCHLLGSSECRSRLELLAKTIGQPQIEVSGVSCLGLCDRAPAIIVSDQVYCGMSIGEYESLIRTLASGSPPPTPESPPKPLRWQIDCYHDIVDKTRYYAAVRELVAEPDQTTRPALRDKDGSGILKALELANLRGMGGAGQCAYEKWRDVLAAGVREGIDEKYIVCNGDESEPGTFKDREILLHAPHLVLEGVIVAGLMMKAKTGYIYIRHEYQAQIQAMEREIARAVELGACGENIFGSGRSFPVEVYVSPGGYICGEQSALIEAMEDKRAEPRNKPPELATNGLWDKPTLLSNVETFAWVPAILLNGPEWYRDLGINGSKGMRFFSISGHVQNPGVYEVPIGLRLGELIEKAGGLVPGKELKAVATSGPSGGFFPPQIPERPGTRPAEDASPAHRDLLSLPLDVDEFRAYGVMLGAGIVVYGSGTDMLDQALCCTSFFKNESCGKCVPCRLGSRQLVGFATEIAEGGAFMVRLDEIEQWVDELRFTLQQTSICGLGVVAAEPLATTFQFFRTEIDKLARNTETDRLQEPRR